MSEPFLERLNRFTPDAGALDRDALLFAAGRASARPNRVWVALTAALAGTQVLSLVLFWPHALPPAVGPGLAVAERGALPAPVERATAERASPGLWSARQDLHEVDADDRPAGSVTFVDTGPTLRAFPPPPSILN